MTRMDTDMKHRNVTEAVIGAAMTVLNTLRPGLDEKLYERALVIELTKRGHTVEQQDQFPVSYDGQNIGVLIPDRLSMELSSWTRRSSHVSMTLTSHKCSAI